MQSFFFDKLVNFSMEWGKDSTIRVNEATKSPAFKFSITFSFQC